MIGLRFSLAIVLGLFHTVSATLLVDYTAPSSYDSLGQCQLEAAELHDSVQCPGTSAVYIKPGKDPKGRESLHFHRDPTYRRAEVKAKGNYASGKKYFVGYEFMLSGIHEHLVIFQWKKEDSSSAQNIPFNLQFSETDHTRLTIGYTPADGGYHPIWTSPNDFQINTLHHIALAFDTYDGSNSLQMWFDGQSVFKTSGLDLWTGATYPKFGIYRGEQGDHDGGSNSNNNVFDLYAYRIQVSDASLDEVKASSGL